MNIKLPMSNTKRTTGLSVVLALVLLCNSLVLGSSTKAALAAPGKMRWNIVETPAIGQLNNIIVSPSEINFIAIGSDGFTLYAVDVANGNLYKSEDGGITWPVSLMTNTRLTAAGASLPVWYVAMAPDDVNFVVAITDSTGPKQVFISRNGGDTWEQAMSGLTINANEYISCLDISLSYNTGSRDIAIGTRDGTGNGKVWTFKTQSWSTGWVDQGLTGDVVAIKYSPTYSGDNSLVAITATGTGTFLNLGFRDTVANTTTWNSSPNYPVEVATVPLTSPNASQIITADLELPSDFSGSDPGELRRYYVNTDTNPPGTQSGVFRIDNTEVYRIKPNITGRISSIAYFGTYAGSKLLAGEVANATPTLSALVNVWRCSDPISNSPAWVKSDQYKSPTGGANSVDGYANAQVAWSPDGTRAYCGTSSADLSVGGTAWAAGQWPFALLTSVALDESAISISPYSPSHELLVTIAGGTIDSEVGNIWNQTGLIDTEITQLSDVAVLEVPADSDNYNVLYLASINGNATVAEGFDSVWRHTGDLLVMKWERILCTNTQNNDTILRINPRGEARSNILAFADRNTNNLMYTSDEGQSWQVLYPGSDTSITDLTLASDDVLYILDDMSVLHARKSGIYWTWSEVVDTSINTGHTITTPLKNPTRQPDDTNEDWVIVGDTNGRMAYADFSRLTVEFKASPEGVSGALLGNMHVVADEKFEQNKMIYAAADSSGKIYRWTAGTSTTWDELRPPNSDFYGIEQRNGVLYGIWNEADAPPITPPGADRTLYSRITVPPYPEWDDLTAGLPTDSSISFTREPTALKLSENDYNNLWAIDNYPYDWAAKIGCLWAYTDTFARVGPWAYAPPSSEIIPVDPVTGRASEVDFSWHQLTYATGYELQIAKDDQFTIRVLGNDHITPADQLAPAVVFPASGLVPVPIVDQEPSQASEIAKWGNIESGHTYYWRVRASRATSGELARSPWSAVLYFTVEAGMPVDARHIGLTILMPPNGAKDTSQTPGFSWSPMPRTTKYEFILSKDAALQNIIVRTKTNTTAYQYEGKLDPNTMYYWQVRPIEPFPGDPSPVANFNVVAAEQPEVEKSKETRIPGWIWPVVIIWSILTIAMIVYANTKPSLVRPKPASNAMQPLIGKSTDFLSSVMTKIRHLRYLRKRKDDL